MNQQFLVTGQNNYKVDGVFGATDYVLPINTTSTHFEEVMKQTKFEGAQQCDQDNCSHDSPVECMKGTFQGQNIACYVKGQPVSTTLDAYKHPHATLKITSKKIEAHEGSTTANSIQHSNS